MIITVTKLLVLLLIALVKDPFTKTFLRLIWRGMGVPP